MEKKTQSLRELEFQAYSGDYSAALNSLARILDRMDRVGPNRLLKSETRETQDQLNLYTRIASVVTTILANPRVEINSLVFTVLMLHKRTLSAIFRVTSFGTMDHIVSLAGGQSGGRQVHMSASSVLKGVFAATVDSPNLNPEGILRQLSEPEKTLFWMSLIDRDYYLTELDEDRRRQALQLSHLIDDGLLPPPFWTRLSNVWMTSSYFNDPDKHEVKKTLNRILRNSLKTEGVTQPLLSKRTIQPRPKIAVFSEHFKHQHAMFRCYGPAIERLSDYFDMVLVTAEEAVDEIGMAMFDEVVSFPLSMSVPDILKKVEKIQADVVYYPSIGMQGWTTAACQLRFAPVQLMTLGHPATSMSEAIDYVLVPERYLSDPDCFSETVVCVEDDAIPFIAHPAYESLVRPERPTNPSMVKIAIPSNGYKLNPAFLSACENIHKQSARPIEFHFFCNLPEHLNLELKLMFEGRFPYVVHMGTGYMEYMKMIGECDLQLSPFPFGNTNGYVDGLLMGLPIVSMDGREVHSRADNVMGRLAGLPEWCLTENIDQYVDAVIRLVNDDQERFALSESILNTDLKSTFFDHEFSPDFGKAIYWIYRNHEAIQERNQKSWKVNDRVEFAPSQ